ncbi:MAG TPA: hypothetical protein ENF73_05100 [Proteobacteria bacterium]|nr:hypothetical protein [Pseudomonadota bacterium]
MKLREIKQILDAETLGKHEDLDAEFKYGYGSDLMSDVLAFIEEDCLLLTGLTTEQVIRTAEVVDIKAIVFVRGKQPPPNVIELADEKGKTLLRTDCTMYLACGKLFAAGLPGYRITRDHETGDVKLHGGTDI